MLDHLGAKHQIEPAFQIVGDGKAEILLAEIHFGRDGHVARQVRSMQLAAANTGADHVEQRSIAAAAIDDAGRLNAVGGQLAGDQVIAEFVARVAGVGNGQLRPIVFVSTRGGSPVGACVSISLFFRHRETPVRNLPNITAGSALR